MNKNLRSALRFAACIRAMGGQPLPIEHRNLRQWALDLQRQHERLRQGMAPEVARAAKVAARALIRQKGYQRAAEEAVPPLASNSPANEVSAYPGGLDHESATTSDKDVGVLSSKERRAMKRDEILCRRKIRHSNLWSALRHAREIGHGAHTYQCWICGGIHVGHHPDSERTREYRRVRRRLQAIGNRLVALEREREALISERSQLMRDLGKADGLALIHPGFAQGMHRLLGAFRLLTDRSRSCQR